MVNKNIFSFDRLNTIIVIIILFIACQSKSQVILAEFIFEQAPFASCHASTIVSLPGNELLVAWFGGPRESHPDVAIWFSKKSAGHWSAPKILAKEKNTPCWNPVFFYTDDHTLWFYYKYGTSPSTWSAARRYSVDHGITWSTTEYLPAGLYGPIRAKPLVLKNGIVVSGTSVESYHNWAVWIERSVDQGKSFNKIGPITVNKNLNLADLDQSHGIIQPSIIAMDDKHLRLYARSTNDIGKVVAADSYDEGLTWSPGYTIDVKNPNSGIDAVKLNDGRIVLIYNDTTEGRSPLNIASSTDGKKFTNLYTLENTPGKEFSYPNIIQTPDGLIHITYTWQRAKIKHVVIKI